ncbi:hypothetical protein GCM10023317_72700 [Actinopolymorpha pittospori]
MAPWAESWSIRTCSQLGAVTGFEADGDTYTVTAGAAKLRVVFEDADLFRIWLAPNGQFTDPANADPEPSDPDAPDADIVVKRDYAGAGSKWRDQGDHYLIRTDKAALRVFKDPLRFALYDATNEHPIWAETEPLSWDDDETTQTLTRGATDVRPGDGRRRLLQPQRQPAVNVTPSPTPPRSPTGMSPAVSRSAGCSSTTATAAATPNCRRPATRSATRASNSACGPRRT